ncbi:ATP-binding protein [Raineyella fluvialis]|uniref:ATP-binding protein n=1 Tax=Raineyella fluvialis TaxID=2662261 RepID=UPI0018909AB0|nr:LuxR C-terminal-related transcriptional regulator [Raineyella fluvialis]
MTELSPSPKLATALTSFIGREELVCHVVELVHQRRLVTLVGPGGIGKTRLATELCAEVEHEFPDGGVVVTLDAVSDPADVAWRTASSVEVIDQSLQDPVAQVLGHLRHRQLLLVLDNCEHLLEAAAGLAKEILRECPGVRIVATSREPLGIAGEQVLVVPPLQVPDSCADLDAVRESEAVRLLVDRADRAGAHLVVGPDNCAQVVELCTHLDGMPLAIELAAARLRALGVGDLLDRLDQRFSLLKGSPRDVLPRHRTLEALIGWSYDLCTPAERLLWSRLSVFRGGADLEAVEIVAGFGAIDPGDVIDLLDGLVAKSVLIAEPADGFTYYRQLVTMRDYGERVAVRSGEWEDLRRRHAMLALERSGQMHREWAGPHQAQWLRRARRDVAEIVAAMDWGISDPAGHDTAAGIASNLRYFWAGGHNMAAGRYRLERVLALPDVAAPQRCECLLVLFWVVMLQGDHADGARVLEEARVLATDLGDRRRLAEVDTWGGLHCLFGGDPAAGVELYQRGIAVLREVGDIAAMQAAMFQLALCQIYSGDPAGGGETCAQILAESRRNGEAWVKAYALWVTGIVHWRQGDLAGVRAYATEALRLQEVFEDGICTPHVLLLACQVVMAAGEVRRAARLQGAADALWRAQGTGIDAFGPGLAGDARESRERILRVLGREEAEALMAQTADLDLREAITVGLAELALTPVEAPVEVGLTKRETQVAELVAEGLSNKQIAARLTISIRTVDGHVERILAKFGVTSRGQVGLRLHETRRQEPRTQETRPPQTPLDGTRL